MSGQKQTNEDLVIDAIRNVVDKISDSSAVDAMRETIKKKSAEVVNYDVGSLKTVVRFMDDETNNTYVFDNKTGQTLAEGDKVWVEYTVNPARGWLVGKLGAYDGRGCGCDGYTGNVNVMSWKTINDTVGEWTKKTLVYEHGLLKEVILYDDDSEDDFITLL